MDAHLWTVCVRPFSMWYDGHRMIVMVVIRVHCLCSVWASVWSRRFNYITYRSVWMESVDGWTHCCDLLIQKFAWFHSTMCMRFVWLSILMFWRVNWNLNSLIMFLLWYGQNGWMRSNTAADDFNNLFFNLLWLGGNLLHRQTAQFSLNEIFRLCLCVWVLCMLCMHVWKMLN